VSPLKVKAAPNYAKAFLDELPDKHAATLLGPGESGGPKPLGTQGVAIVRTDAGTAANNSFVGCELTDNYWHEVDSCSGANNNHGINIGCFYNHALYQDIYITGIGQNGQIFTGCWFAGNAGAAITLYHNMGVCFNDCHWDSGGIFLTNTSTANCLNYVRNFTFGGAWSASGIGTDGKLLLEGGYSQDTQPDLAGIAIAATGVTNLGPRQAMAMVTATAATFWVTNYYGLPVQTNTTVTGTYPVQLRFGECIHAASGLAGYLYW